MGLWATVVGASPAFAEPVPLPDAIADHKRAVECIASAIVHEAGFEPLEGQEAVAQVILNRVRAPLFPKTICGVVFAGSARATGCQFSFTCDGSLGRKLPERIWTRARMIAEGAIDGVLPDRVAGATHYHADYVSPYWAPSLVRIVKIGAHIFYRLPGVSDPRPTSGAYIPAGEPLMPGDGPANAETIIAASRGAAVAVAATPYVFAPWGLAAPGGPR